MLQDVLVSAPYLALFRAIAGGEREHASALLRENPRLLTEKTITTGSTWLHLAAQRGDTHICDDLIRMGHEVNPMNNEGKTPYQLASLDEVRAVLVEKQLKHCVEEYVLVLRDSNFSREITFNVFNNDEFNSRVDNDAMLQHVHITTEETGERVCFRADVLMQPYLGPLFVIYANLVLMHLYSEKVGQDAFHPLFQACFYLTCINHAVAHFPFLIELPHEEDKNEISLAKKLFISSFVSGFIMTYNQCDDEQKAQLEHQHGRGAIEQAQTWLQADGEGALHAFDDELKQVYGVVDSEPAQEEAAFTIPPPVVHYGPPIASRPSATTSHERIIQRHKDCWGM